MGRVGGFTPVVVGDSPSVFLARRTVDFFVRSMVEGEGAALGAVFYRAVREGAARAYSTEQRAAWAPHAPGSVVWRRRLKLAETVVAESDGQAVGFMAMERDTGHLDLAFVLPEVMGSGVAQALYAVLENRARAAGLHALTCEASELARPFLLRQGWAMVRRQSVERDGVALTNYRMTKALRVP